MRSKTTKIDKILEDMTRFKEEHRVVTLKHVARLAQALNKDEISIEETMQTLKGLLVSLSNLKKHYDTK